MLIDMHQKLVSSFRSLPLPSPLLPPMCDQPPPLHFRSSHPCDDPLRTLLVYHLLSAPAYPQRWDDVTDGEEALGAEQEG
jgi:hypothetical protein